MWRSYAGAPGSIATCHHPRLPVTCYLCEHERAIKPYGLEVSKTSRKGGRDSLGLSLNLVSGAFYIYGHCHYITFTSSLRPRRLSVVRWGKGTGAAGRLRPTVKYRGQRTKPT